MVIRNYSDYGVKMAALQIIEDVMINGKSLNWDGTLLEVYDIKMKISKFNIIYHQGIWELKE